MGVRFPSVSTSGIGAALPASSAETVVYTVGPLILPIDNAAVFLFWHYTLTAGTGTANLQFRLRRGSTVSASQINLTPNGVPLAAGAVGLFSGTYQDLPGSAGPLFYSLTVVQNTATAAGINTDGALLAFAL